MAEPLSAFGLLGEADASKVEPLIGALFVVAGYHVAIGHVLAEAVERFSQGLLSRKRRGRHVAGALLDRLGGLRSLSTESSEQLLILFVGNRLYLGALSDSLLVIGIRPLLAAMVNLLFLLVYSLAYRA